MDEELDDEVLDEDVNTEEEGDPEDPGDEEATDPVDEGEVDPVTDDGIDPDDDWSETATKVDARGVQVFTSQPVPPYYIGDVWDSASGLMVCVADSDEVFDADDWSPVEVEPVQHQTQTVTKTIREPITDFSAASLAAYETAGATAWAIYDDGTEAQVQWSQVVEPSLPVVAADEALEAALANGQHFWHNDSDASTHGGAGVHVTDQTQEDWDDAVADGFSDLTTNKPYHNILINSLGILLRSALNHLVSITRSAISFFDGSGNNAANITASFGANGAQIGKTSGKHVNIDSNGVKITDGTRKVASFSGGGINLDTISLEVSVEEVIVPRPTIVPTPSVYPDWTVYDYNQATGQWEQVTVPGSRTSTTVHVPIQTLGSDSPSVDYFKPALFVQESIDVDGSGTFSGIVTCSDELDIGGFTRAHNSIYVDGGNANPPIVVGDNLAPSQRLEFYSDKVYARAYNSAYSAFTLDAHRVIVPGTLKLTSTTDASGTADNQPALMIGNESGKHLELDGDEIMAKASGTTTSTLYINNEGGLVVVGSGGIRTAGKYIARHTGVTAGTAPSEQTYKQVTEVQDSAGNVVGHDEYTFYTDKGIGHNFAAVRQKVGDTFYWYQSSMKVDSAGTVTYSIHTPSAFRSAIGAAASSHTHSYLPLSGGEMTGQITMKNATAMPRATGGGWYPIVMDSFSDGGGLYYMQPADVPALIGAAAASALTKSAPSAADDFTPASGYSLASGDIYKAGSLMVSVRLGIKTTNALTSGTDYTVGTLASGLRPHANMYLTANDSKYFNTWVTSNGVVHIKPTANVSANTTMFFSGTWVISS